MINRFDGTEYDFLSNFYEAPVEFEGIIYRNSEAAYQAGKTIPSERIKFSNLSAADAKRLGRSIEMQPNWDRIKADYMKRVVHAKFTQNPKLAEMLLQTGDEELEEGNTWHDNFFGNCYCNDCITINGKNWLGKILMDEREYLRKQS